MPHEQNGEEERGTVEFMELGHTPQAVTDHPGSFLRLAPFYVLADSEDLEERPGPPTQAWNGQRGRGRSIGQRLGYVYPWSRRRWRPGCYSLTYFGSGPVRTDLSGGGLGGDLTTSGPDDDDDDAREVEGFDWVWLVGRRGWLVVGFARKRVVRTWAKVLGGLGRRREVDMMGRMSVDQGRGRVTVVKEAMGDGDRGGNENDSTAGTEWNQVQFGRSSPTVDQPILGLDLQASLPIFLFFSSIFCLISSLLSTLLT